MRHTLTLAGLLLGLPGLAQTQRQYDSQGRSTGRAQDRGATRRLYDAQGRGIARIEKR